MGTSRKKEKFWGDLLKLFFFAAGFFAVTFAFAQSDLSDLTGEVKPIPEQIENFHSEINVQKNGTISVTETIVYNFGTAEKHGIYRYIPTTYLSDIFSPKMKISNIGVEDDNGNLYFFTVTNSYNQVTVKIGDPNQTVTGVQTYVISYRVSGVIGYKNDFDEIYWNVTGNGWTVPILNSSATINLPAYLAKNLAKASCYSGYSGSAQNCYSNSLLNNSEERIDYVEFAENSLSPKQGLTVAVGFPKGFIAEPTIQERTLAFVVNNIFVFSPILVFFIMLLLWFVKGRDPRGRGTIIPEYDAPPNFTPAESAAILRQKIRGTDLSAEIIYLAVNGYIKIEKTEEKGLVFKKTEYFLTQIKNEEETLNPFDKKLIQELFSGSLNMSDLNTASLKNEAFLHRRPEFTQRRIRLSDLKNKFFTSVPKIIKIAFLMLTARNYFKDNPQKVKSHYIKIGIAIIFLSFICGFLIPAFFSPINAAGSVLSGIIIIIFGSYMPSRTELGVSTKESLLGLKEYLQIAEKDRLKFHNAPEKNPQIFEKLLPYAMVLGVEKAWAKEFQDIYVSPPSWYSDSGAGNSFNSIYFVNSLGGFHGTMAGAMAGGTSGSGGGGSSGGGGGGGGGGSW
ncbi:MAG: DUF2207 domain-containing protein [Candidatus Paceibacterota bacterium]|jgi:uncharacterized membrane protein